MLLFEAKYIVVILLYVNFIAYNQTKKYNFSILDLRISLVHQWQLGHTAQYSWTNQQGGFLVDGGACDFVVHL